MTGGDDNDNDTDPFIRALNSVTQGPKVVATELRAMADGKDPYRRFTYTSPSIKNIWRAAADLLDPV